MKCSLSGQNTRILAKAVQSFARIGTELYFEASLNGLILRTVNDSQTAFGVMTFETGFFTDFKIDRSNSDEYSNKCKISMKSCLAVLKSMGQIEKCQITLNSKTSKLHFKFNCLFDTVKTHVVSFLEQETLSAIYLTTNAPNSFTAKNKFFTEIIASNFRIYDNEIAIKASSDSIILENYIDLNTEKHLMRTEVTLRPHEFEEYRITQPTTITFCLKELRAILNFTDALSLNMTVNFESAGKAVVFAFGSKDAFTANFVMSTLLPDDIPHDNGGSDKCLDTTEKTNCSISENNDLLQPKPSHTANQVVTKPLNEVIDLNENDDVNMTVAQSPTITNSKQSDSVMESNTIPPTRLILARDTESEEICVSFRSESEILDDEIMEIPASPKPEKRRRLRKFFPRCFEKTQYADNLSGNVLAVASDDEL